MPHRTHRLHACTGTWTGADADARPRHRQATGREHTHWLRVAMPPTPAPCAPHSHMGRCAAMRHFKRRAAQHHRWRPYRVEYTGSLLTSEVKRHRARLVLGWGTAREDLWVLSALPFSCFRFGPLARPRSPLFGLTQKESPESRNEQERSEGEGERRQGHVQFCRIGASAKGLHQIVADGHTVSNAPDLI